MSSAYDLAVRRVVDCVKASEGMNVQFESGTLTPSADSISINAKEIVISDPKAFAEVTSSASNFEIYPKTDGTVQFDMMFYRKKGAGSL